MNHSTQAWYLSSNVGVAASLEVQHCRSIRSALAQHLFEKVKSPAELVASVLRLTGEFERPRREILDTAMHMVYMGQHLINPPSVEGWHQGVEWIDTGTLIERVNFASKHFGNLDAPAPSMTASVATPAR